MGLAYDTLGSYTALTLPLTEERPFAPAPNQPEPRL